MHLAVSKGGDKNVTGPMSEINVQNITKFHHCFMSQISTCIFEKNLKLRK